MKNIIDAVVTLIKRNEFTLTDAQGGNNRINIRGDALELYVKNLFADTFDNSETDRLEKWSEIFSYLGNSSNPPDFMLRNGDAVEVKKIESPDAALALNSSYPKHTLKSSSTLISRACREAGSSCRGGRSLSANPRRADGGLWTTGSPGSPRSVVRRADYPAAGPAPASYASAPSRSGRTG